MPQIHPIAALVKRNEDEIPARLAQLQTEVTELIELGQVVEQVKSEDDATQAADVAKMCREKRREVETWRDGLVRPLNEMVKQVNGVLKKGIQGKLEKEERRLKLITALWLREVEREAEEARAKAEAERPDATETQADLDALVEPAAKASPAGGFGRISTQRVWKWRILKGGLALIPREYLIADEQMLNVLAKTSRPEIPGVEWFEDARPVLR